LMRNAESEAQWKMHALRAAPSPSYRGPGLSPPGLLFVSRADKRIGSNHRVGSAEQRHTAHRQCPGRAEGFCLAVTKNAAPPTPGYGSPAAAAPAASAMS